jgi:hypothetical protein
MVKFSATEQGTSNTSGEGAMSNTSGESATSKNREIQPLWDFARPNSKQILL